MEIHYGEVVTIKTGFYGGCKAVLLEHDVYNKRYKVLVYTTYSLNSRFVDYELQREINIQASNIK